MFLKTVSVCAVFFAAASAAPEEFKKAENLIRNGCVCGKLLYEKDFETRRLNALNSCVEELFGAEFKYKGADPVGLECPDAAIKSLSNLRKFADWKLKTFDESQRTELDDCFYGKLGFRNEDGSANVEAIMNEIKRGQLAERDRGLAHLKRANREADADKKADFMSKFNDATFAYKFLTHMSSRANDSTVCSNNEVAKHYRCTFSDCFAKSLGVPDF